MSIIAKVHIEHDRLALIPTLRSLDGAEIRVIPQGNTAPGSTMFPFLINYDDRQTLEEMLDEDPTVQSYDLIDWTDGTGLYYIEHTEETRFISTVVTEVNGFLIDTETEDKGWLVRLLLPDKQALTTVWEHANEEDISLEIVEVYSHNGIEGKMSYGLTDEQRTTLQLAYEKGYFKEPRDISLKEVSDELDLSSTATSGRLRRGMRTLISATLIENDDEE